MRAGWVGLGKIGLPCALAMAQAHDVLGYDLSDSPQKILAGELAPPREQGLEELLGRAGRLALAGSSASLAASCEVVFVCVPTPHLPGQGGECLRKTPPSDFEYRFLVQACRDVCDAAAAFGRHLTLAVVSTVLPGTMSRLIVPLASPRHVTVVYSPALVALGDVIGTFASSPLVICGTCRPGDEEPVVRALDEMRRQVRPGVPRELLAAGMETAEMTKIAWNAYASVKIMFANMLMELCHRAGGDVDLVTGALRLADDGRYLRGGTGPAGPCHPRDLAALSWLAGRQGLSYDLAGDLLAGRERQARWLASLAEDYRVLTGLPAVVLGTSYKPESDVTEGSVALLLRELLGLPPAVSYGEPPRAVYLVATACPEYAEMPVPAGSVVIDPHGYMPDQPGVTTIRVGRR